jgi:hypothetical protein
MLDYLSGVPRRLECDFVPSPSGGGLHAVQEEEVHHCYIVLQGYTPDLHSPDRVECPALVTGVGFTQVVFGYPNEEAYWEDARDGLEHGFFEVEGSGWSAAIDDYNNRSIGTAYFRGRSQRHFFIGSKDASCQLLADDLKVEVFPGHQFIEVVGMIQQRIHEYFSKG